MMDFLRYIEGTGFSQWVIGSSSIFAYPSILLLHTLGMGVVVGISAGIDLRILGLAPALPLSPIEKFFPLFWVGFWVNTVTGVILLAADATTKFTNLDFYVKMVFIVLAVILFRMIRSRVFGDPAVDKKVFPTDVKLLATASMICWLGAITAGRLLGYLGPVSGLAG
jgi:hypothetical protein